MASDGLLIPGEGAGQPSPSPQTAGRTDGFEITRQSVALRGRRVDGRSAAPSPPKPRSPAAGPSRRNLPPALAFGNTEQRPETEVLDADSQF